MLAIALVVYVAAAFFDGQEDPRFAVFTEKAKCEEAVAVARASRVFTTDCVAVTLPAPRVASKNGA